MAFMKRRTRSRPSTTPNYDRATGGSFFVKIGRALLVPSLLLAALGWFGQPALRIEYSYLGDRANPIFTRCLYLALDGWHRVTPLPVAGQCPVIAFMPIDLIGFLAGRT